MCRPCWCGTFAVLGYVIALIVVAVVAGKARRNIWSSDVKEIQRSQVPNNHGMGIFNPPNPTVAIYPPIGNPNYNVPRCVSTTPALFSATSLVAPSLTSFTPPFTSSCLNVCRSSSVCNEHHSILFSVDIYRAQKPKSDRSTSNEKIQ